MTGGLCTTGSQESFSPISCDAAEGEAFLEGMHSPDRVLRITLASTAKTDGSLDLVAILSSLILNLKAMISTLDVFHF